MEPIEAEAMRWLAGAVRWERALGQLRCTGVRAPAAGAVVTGPGPLADVGARRRYPYPARLEIAPG